MKSPLIFCLLPFVLAATTEAAIVNYVITGYAAGSGPVMSIGAGATTDVVSANASGGLTNVSTSATVGAFVDFTVGNASAIDGDKLLASNINALSTVATLRVTLNAISSPGGNQSNVMIARTSNSQGLADVGTLTLLVTGPNGSNSNTLFNSATFSFQWRNAANDAALTGSNQYLITSYDIDFTQRNSIPTIDIASIYTSGINSKLTVSPSGGFTRVQDPGPGTASTVGESNNAFAFITNPGDSTQTISVDKIGGGKAEDGYGQGGNQLYMFSFRSPSPLIPAAIPSAIPEPSCAIIVSFGSLVGLRRRRSSCQQG